MLHFIIFSLIGVPFSISDTLDVGFFKWIEVVPFEDGIAFVNRKEILKVSPYEYRVIYFGYRGEIEDVSSFDGFIYLLSRGDVYLIDGEGRTRRKITGLLFGRIVVFPDFGKVWLISKDGGVFEADLNLKKLKRLQGLNFSGVDKIMCYKDTVTLVYPDRIEIRDRNGKVLNKYSIRCKKAVFLKGNLLFLSGNFLFFGKDRVLSKVVDFTLSDSMIYAVSSDGRVFVISFSR